MGRRERGRKERRPDRKSIPFSHFLLPSPSLLSLGERRESLGLAGCPGEGAPRPCLFSLADLCVHILIGMMRDERKEREEGAEFKSNICSSANLSQSVTHSAALLSRRESGESLRGEDKEGE